MAKRALSSGRCAIIEGLFANLQILSWGSDEASAYARVRAKLEAQGITVSAMDMMIAAQAIAANATLVTADKIFVKMEGLTATANWTEEAL
jgi:tRNA(fMet)-specific endonuclease VapC